MGKAGASRGALYCLTLLFHANPVRKLRGTFDREWTRMNANGSTQINGPLRKNAELDPPLFASIGVHSRFLSVFVPFDVFGGNTDPEARRCPGQWRGCACAVFRWVARLTGSLSRFLD
jgi:hypothetical protein